MISRTTNNCGQCVLEREKYIYIYCILLIFVMCLFIYLLKAQKVKKGLFLQPSLIVFS